MLRRNKVYAYIIRGEHLLVFRHVDFPKEGIQIPGGTVEEGEDPALAVLREAFEETGLESLQKVSYLGSDEWVMLKNNDEEMHYFRYFYPLICEPPVPDSWLHDELYPSDGSPAPITFEFYWLPVAEAASSLHPCYAASLDRLFDNLPGHPRG